ncbi:MAG: Sporulation thiol-disulfide oxidoreductase precursor [Pseudomonadota bacterium]
MPPDHAVRIDRRQASQWLAASALAATGLAAAQTPSEAALEARAPAMPALGTRLQVPDIALLDGTPFHATPGQPLLIYWWSSTCPFCAQQSPAMQALWQAQQARGLQMLALSIDKSAQEARAYLRRKGYSFPAAWASAEWRRAFPKPKGLPITLLLDRQQQLVLAEKGQMFDEDVQAIARLV